MTIDQLKKDIALLELQQSENYTSLKDQFSDTYESLRPINFIKNTFNALSNSPDFKDDLLNSSMGIAAGYLSKKVLFGATHNPVKQILGTLLQFGITGYVSNNGDEIKNSVTIAIRKLFNMKESKDDVD